MNWTAYVDGYCERVAPGLWGEPLNDVTNLAFLGSAIAVWWRADGRRTGRTLAVLVGLVFLASTVFHLLATRWGGAADSGFILVFVLYYAAKFPQVFFGVPLRKSWLAAPAFVVLTAAPAALGGGLYLPALIGLAVFAGVLAYARDPYWTHFAVAGAVFALSLALRTIDGVVCGDFPVGTHFLWHLLNAVVLYVVSNAMIGKEKAPSPEPVRGPSTVD
ncbi:hypothetical protein [Amycolatopsis sp. DSM 110486]|uniref:hypothetical protein n=1 Tax=Amycolatopsis sp. DSM 110486 TaxID=2865832 RepID=UPI001C698415|nr:hypothetical protein [Amycolatopsis sp. DSM 110486]QYN24066.1 hypothetical protein K1T34_17425 [Amycolatopsis sp. DSM 110486]